MAVSLKAHTDGVTGILQANGVDCVQFNAAGITSGSAVQVLNNTVGYNQTWQNVLASRALGTTYTNSTGKPITVMITGSGVANVSYTTLQAYVSSVMIAASTGTNNGSAINPCVAFVVPPGALYSCSIGGNNGSLALWFELR